MATVTQPQILANFVTSLATELAAAGTTLTLNRSTDNDGNTLSGEYILTIDEGTSSEEHMIVDMTGASGSISRRGLSRVDGWTEQAANQYKHERGKQVKCTNFSIVLLNRLLNGDDTFDSVDWTGVNSIDGLATPGAGETTKSANVEYVNNATQAGVNDAAQNVKGIVEIATDAELASGALDGSGDTTAPLVSHAASFNVTPGANKVPVADGSNKIAQGWLNLGESWQFTDVLDVATATNFQLGSVAYTGTMADLNEASDFFQATNISGAEAETVTDGSNADSLHYHSLQSYFTCSAPSISTSFRFGQITTNADGSRAYVVYAASTEPNISLTVLRYDRDARTGMYYFVGEVSLGEVTYGWKDGDQAGIWAGSTYVWVAGRSDAGGNDIKIVRLDADLANPTALTISGAANYTDVNACAGDDSKVWVAWDAAATDVGYYTISGTTATVGSNITIAENTDDVAGFFYDGIDLIVQDNTGYGNIIRYNVSGVSQATLDANVFVNGLDDSEPRGSLFGIGYHSDNSIWMLGAEGLADAANDVGIKIVGIAVTKP